MSDDAGSRSPPSRSSSSASKGPERGANERPENGATSKGRPPSQRVEPATPRTGTVPPTGDLSPFTDFEMWGSFISNITDELSRGFTGRTIGRLGRTALRGGRALLRPESFDRAAEAGRSLRDAREVAGLTVKELSEALELQDEGLLDAVEKGTATLSFELILRLASLLARHDPIPFVMKYLRTYDPAVWQFLHDWGLGRLPLAYERERRFVNIYRSRDAARQLDEEAFDHLLKFTDNSFALALEELSGQRAKEEELAKARAELDRERKAFEAEKAELRRERRAVRKAAGKQSWKVSSSRS